MRAARRVRGAFLGREPHLSATFRARLASAIAERGPLCAGIDPTASALRRFGLDDTASGAAEFALRCLDAFADHVAMVKPNAAFFEQYGAAGLRALESLIARARDAGVLVLVDAKRGDIASTNEAYARAWLDDASPLAADAVTVSPYLGTRALAPFFDTAEGVGRGVFVVVRSSNPEGRSLQRAVAEGGLSVEERLLDEVRARPGTVGAVVGILAQVPPLSVPDQGFYLVPGLFSQGATLDDLQSQAAGMGNAPVVVNLSRALYDAGPDPDALREAAARASRDIARRLLPAEG